MASSLTAQKDCNWEFCTLGTPEWAAFLLRLSTWPFTEILTFRGIQIWCGRINTNTIISSVKFGFWSFRAAQDVSHLSHHCQFQFSHCRCAERLINKEFWLLEHSQYYRRRDQQLRPVTSFEKETVGFPLPFTVNVLVFGFGPSEVA